jgi:PAS domain S-box-containing protein
MNLYAITSLFAFMVCFFLGSFIYHQKKDNSLNKIVALLSISIGFLVLVEFLYRQATDYQTAYFWLKVSTLWPFIPAILLNIALIFTNQKIIKHKLTYVLIYLPAVLISGIALSTNLLLDGITHTYWGWTYNFPQNMAFFYIMSLWTIIAALSAVLLCFLHYLKSDGLKKKEASYLLVGLYFPIIISVLTDFISPLFYVRIPEMTLTLSTAGIFLISYGIWKYRFPSLTSPMVTDKIVSNMSNFLLLLTNNGTINSYNPSAANLLGYSIEDLNGIPLSSIFANKQDAEEIFSIKNYQNFYRSQNINNVDTVFKAKNNEKIPVSISICPLIENKELMGLVCIGNDIKDVKKVEKVEKSLEEKNVLLSEIHHRVKNNLQIISSLLNLQSHYIDDEKDKIIFKDSQSRVKSMAMIHEKLYQSLDFSKVDFKGYIFSLTTHLFQTYNTNSENVKLNLDVEDIALNMDTAIPCGLIINELLSNSLKYAFPHGKKGCINIKLKSEDSLLILEIEDNGIGFPEGYDFDNNDSLGLQLVSSLVRQIEGKLEIIAKDGTKFKIIFPHKS